MEEGPSWDDTTPVDTGPSWDETTPVEGEKPPRMFLSQDESGRMVAAPSTEYNEEKRTPFGQRAWEGVKAPYQEPLGFSKETLEKYPALEQVQRYVPGIKIGDALMRAPAAALYGLAGAAGDIYEDYGGQSAMADRLTRDLVALGQSAAPEMPREGGALPIRQGLRKAQMEPPLRKPAEPPPIPAEPPPAIPRQVMRPDAGVDLLPAETPHTLPPERRSLGAAGAGGPLAGVSEDTKQFLRDQLRKQYTPHSLDARLEEMSAHQFLGELDENTEALMGGAASGEGPGKVEVIQSEKQRHAEAPERVSSEFDRAFGPAENLATLERMEKAAQKQASDPLYQAFRDTVITPSPEIDALMPRLRASGAMQAANKAMAEEGAEASRGFLTNETPPEIHPVPTAQAFQHAKEFLDDKIESSLRNGENKAAHRYIGLRNDLLDALDNHPNIGDAWRKARETYASFADLKTAREMGRNILNNKIHPDEVPYAIERYSDAQMRALRIGLRGELETQLGGKELLQKAMIDKLLSPNNAKKIRSVIDREKADNLIAAIRHEGQMHGASTRIYGGSQTAPRNVINQLFNPPPKAGSVDLEAVAQGLAHPKRTLIKKGFEKIGERWSGAERKKLEEAMARRREETARIFTLQGPERDAVARYLVGGEERPATPALPVPGLPTRAEGGRINDFHRARYAYMIKKQGGGELGESWQPGQEEQPAAMPAPARPAALDTTHLNEPFGELKPGEPVSAYQRVADRLLGRHGEERFQWWPERLARAGLQGLKEMPEQLLTLPKRTFEANQRFMETGEYDPAPFLEAASLPMGIGTAFGVPAKASEAVFAAGAGRRRPPRPPIPVATEDAAAVNPRAVVGSNQPVEQAVEPAARRGLSFPEEQSAERLRLKVQREEKARTTGAELPGQPANERTVIKAPKGSDLPDFVAGKITPEDWIKRTEQMLTPEEIHKSAKWYDEIYDNFLHQTKGNEELARKYMRGWLVAQQNVDVSGAMRNTLLQREQILRGVPEEQMIAAGMPNPTLAARRVMQGRDIEQGVGQKIADFVDSAEGSDTRAWMGHHPHGGSPFVVDVHTARDTGMVDQELVNHLTRLGYDKKGIAKLKTDLGTSPTATQYENRASFGRELTDYLNQKNWMGRSDWTPKEVQAVGWMGMTKLTANKAEDVVTGLGSQMRHLSMEVAPGEGSPWAAKYGDRFSSLSPAEQYKITHAMTQDAVERASQLAGIDVRDIVHGTGGWMNFQNPSTVAQVFSSPQGAEIAANALGHMLQQTEVWANKVKPPTANPKGFAVDIMASGEHRLGTDEGLREMWGKIMAADPTGKLFQGYQPIVGRDGRVGIRALIDRGGVKTKADLENALSGPVEKVLKSLPGHYDTHLAEAEITKARNDWTKDAHGHGYTSRLADLLGRDPAADLNRHGQELEEQFRQAIEAAEARAAGAKAKARGGVASYARGGRVTYRWPLATAPPPIRQWYARAAR